MRLLRMRWYVAVVATACPIPSADFLQEVVHDGLAKGDGDHRDVTVHRDMGFHFLNKNKEKHNCFRHFMGLFELLIA